MISTSELILDSQPIDLFVELENESQLVDKLREVWPMVLTRKFIGSIKLPSIFIFQHKQIWVYLKDSKVNDIRSTWNDDLFFNIIKFYTEEEGGGGVGTPFKSNL